MILWLQQRKNESMKKGDSSGSTASTMGLESHSEEHHDPNNGDESAQHHNHQTGLARLNH